MRTARKKIISFLLVLTLMIGLIPAIGQVARAAGTMQNVSISSDGIMTWDAFPDATAYDFTIGSGGGFVYETSVDLAAKCAAYGYNTGTYNVKLFALDKPASAGGTAISEVWTGTYSYTAPGKLDTPAHVRWSGTTLLWDPVTNADSYTVYINGRHLITEDTSYDLTYVLNDGTQTYTYQIEASSSLGYAKSDRYEGEITLTVDKPAIQNVSISSDGILKWDTFPGVKTYRLEGEEADYISASATSRDLYELYYSRGTESGTYEVTLVALDNPLYENGNLISKVWKGTYTFVRPDQVTVTFNANGGSVSTASANVNASGKLASLPTPVRDGYSFTGWYTAASGGEKAGTDTVFIRNTTLYAQWNQLSYTVSFDSHSGSAVPSQTVVHGGKVTKPADPIRGGFVFENWYSDEAYTEVYDFNTPVTGPKTLYAKWTPILHTYTVTFDVDGGSAVPSQTVTENTKAEKPASNPTKEGFTFVGWFANSRKTRAFDFDNTLINSDTTIYAKWVEEGTTQYNVFFGYMDDSGNFHTLYSSNTKVYSGDTVIRPTTDPERDGGYVFVDWYEDAALTTLFDFENTIITGARRIYSKWVEGYTVTFETVGGGSNLHINVEKESTVAKPADPVKEGYVFAGWYKDMAGTEPFDFATPITGDITLYAKWTEESAVTLPKVIGVSLNVTGTQENSGAYDVKTDTLSALFESTNAPVTMGISFLYTDQACQIEDKLTTAPVAGTPYFFVVTIDAYTDGDPATLEWADNDTIKSGSTLTANNGAVEIVEFFHSPAGGSLSIICKYTETSASAVTYLVVFDMNGKTGTEADPNSRNVLSGDTVAKPTDPSAEGFTFEGWYTDAACTTVFDFATPITGDITLYAKWTENTTVTYLVTFDMNGKTGTPADPSSRNVLSGDTVTAPAAPKAEGFTFTGWYTDAACTTAFDFTTPITKDTVLYAGWTADAPVTFLVTFDMNGKTGTEADPNSRNVLNGDTVVAPKDPSAEGFTFAGWYTDAACTTAFDFTTPITKDTILYAKWTEKSAVPETPAEYTISYDLNGGTLDGKTGKVTLKIAAGTVITLPEPTREGYTFDYWEGSRYEAGASYKVEGDHTFTAQWKANSANGSEIPKTGDSSHFGLWFLLTAIFLADLILLGALYRRRRVQQ